MGNFLGMEHTVEHLRGSYWMPELFSRQDFESWRRDGGKTILERAHEFVERTTAGYQEMEPVLDADVCRELDGILAEAWREAG